MVKYIAVMLTGIAGLAWLAVATAAQEKADKADTLAKEATEQFMKAMKAENIDAVMKIVEVPYFWDGVKNIKDRDELKQGFAKIFAEKDLTKLEYTVKEVNTFATGQEKFSAKDRKLLNEILEKDDRIVHVKVKREGIAIAVRIRDGKANVAGFRD